MSNTNSFRVSRCIGFFCVLLSVLWVFPTVASDEQAKAEVKNTLSVADLPNYHNLKAALKNVVLEDAVDKKRPHYFYITKYNSEESAAYMIWPRGKKIWLLNVSVSHDYKWPEVNYPTSGMLLDFNTDVVNTDEEVGSSTYLVPKPWVADHMFNAITHGDLIIID